VQIVPTVAGLVPELNLVKEEPLMDKKPEEMEKTLNNLKRHYIGLGNILDDMGAFTPKCKICFEKYGWLSRCECPAIK
jgi:hypothetical protein